MLIAKPSSSPSKYEKNASRKMPPSRSATLQRECNGMALTEVMTATPVMAFVGMVS